MKKIRCFKCRGKGTQVPYEHKVAAICSFGILTPLLLVTEDCDACDGLGYIFDE